MSAVFELVGSLLLGFPCLPLGSFYGLRPLLAQKVLALKGLSGLSLSW